MKIQLSTEQQEAIQKIKEFVLFGEGVAFSLTGAAGTGKTLIMNTLVSELEEVLPIELCAPTHKAKLVLEKATDRMCSTIHSLLALTPNLDIFELDLNDLLFKSRGDKVTIPQRGLVICDEASMINDNLFKALTKKCSERDTKILFVSDEKQLRPVKSEKESLVYSVENNFRLTKIFRQSDKNAILPVLETLRHKYLTHFESKEGEEGSLYCTNDLQEFLKKYIKNIKKAIDNSDILETKLTAFTNSRINLYNSLVKKILYPNGKEYNKTEFLTCCDNLTYKGNVQFWNSMDYIVYSEPREVEKDLPYFEKTVKGWILTLYDSVLKVPFEVFILSKHNANNVFNSLAFKIDALRVLAIKKRSPAAWGMYFSLIQSFASPVDLMLDGRLIKKKTFVEGYACTAHKLQGSSIENIYVDMRDINRCFDLRMKQQLQYVALSRTRHNAYVLQ